MMLDDLLQMRSSLLRDGWSHREIDFGAGTKFEMSDWLDRRAGRAYRLKNTLTPGDIKIRKCSSVQA